MKAPDGKYHMFASRWDQSRGHNGWFGSQAVHAVSENAIGPYKDMGLTWPDNQGGKGHNVTALVLPDKRYAVVRQRDAARGRLRVEIARRPMGAAWHNQGRRDERRQSAGRENVQSQRDGPAGRPLRDRPALGHDLDQLGRHPRAVQDSGTKYLSGHARSADAGSRRSRRLVQRRAVPHRRELLERAQSVSFDFAGRRQQLDQPRAGI